MDRCFIVCLFGFLILCAAGSSTGSLRLTAYPEAVLADGRSLTTLSAEVRARDGKPVPDGTQVAFSTTLGTFREAVVQTEGGVARAILVAGQIAGIAKVTASALGFGAVGEIQVLFAKDRSELDNITDYVEITAPDYLAYAVDLRLIAATGPQKKAFVHYRFSTIEADDLQLDCQSLLVRARRASLHYGPTQQEYEELFYSLRTGEGYGIAQREGEWSTWRIRNGQEEPTKESPSPSLFQFADLSQTQMLITAHHIWFYPGDKLQFRRAEFWVGATKAFSLPLYSHSLWASSISEDSLLGVRDGQFYLDLPYYYALNPRTTGAIRLRTQQRSGRGYSAARGWFLDLEHQYRGSNRSYGTLILSSLVRNDWGATWRHFQPLGTNAQVYLWLDSPAHSGLFGSLQATRQWKGLHGGLTLSGSRFWQGSGASSRRADLYLETLPQNLAGTPFRCNFSLSGSINATNTGISEVRRQGVGLRYRLLLNPVNFGKSTSLTGGLTIGRYGGNLGNRGWEVLGTVGVTQSLGSFGSLSLTYDYTQDPLSAFSLGRHRLSGNLYGSDGKRFDTSIYLSRGLDQRSTSLLGDFSYRLSPVWRLGLGLTWQDYIGFTYRDYTLTLAYRLGYRELALTWSYLTRRWSFDILTVPF